MTTENRWGRPGFEKQISDVAHIRSLSTVTAALQLSTRQRIYAYLQRGGTFQRGTWNGCVMNVASGGVVSSVHAAAIHFDEPVNAISNFIGEWDSTRGTDAEASRVLENILLSTGLTEASPKYEAPPEHEKVKVFRVRLFTSTETKLVEELRAEIEAGAFDADLAEFKELVGASS